MSNLTCPHCQSIISIAGLSPGQTVTCGQCGGAVQIPGRAAAPQAALPKAAPLPQQALPMRAPVPIPARASASPVGPAKATVDPSAAVQPVTIADQGKPSSVARGRSKKRNPLFTMVAGFLVTSVILSGGMLLAFRLMRSHTVGDWKEKDPGAIVVKKQVGGRVQPAASGYRPKGPRLDITRTQFRDKMEELPHDYDPTNGYDVYRSGRDLVDAFGKPHRIRPVGNEIHYFWNCSDHTLKVVCDGSATPLEDRTSLIVYRIDNEWY